MFHGVAGGLGLGSVLDIGQGDHGAGINLIALLNVGADAVELVTSVGLLSQSSSLNHDLRIGVVDPGGAGVGLGISGLLLTGDNVLHSVAGGLGLGIVLFPLSI